MNKRGFTLAEVLITLGIVGVVAALTAPALVQNAGSAQVGPKLAKAVSTIETATETTLLEEGTSSVYPLFGDSHSLGGTGVSAFTDKLADHMKMTKSSVDALNGKWTSNTVKTYDGSETVRAKLLAPYGTPFQTASVSFFGRNTVVYLSKEGMLYSFAKGSASPRTSYNINKAPSHQIIGSVVIDVNGLSGPNRLGKDVFVFSWWNDGSLRPFGSKNFTFRESASKGTEENDKGELYWATTCSENGVTEGGLYCAGSIFENNLKVIYQ